MTRQATELSNLEMGESSILPRELRYQQKNGQSKCHIETEVVPTNIPLLLSKTSLKKEGAVLDIQNDKAVIFKQSVTLEFTTSGHYCVNILEKNIR